MSHLVGKWGIPKDIPRRPAMLRRMRRMGLLVLVLVVGCPSPVVVPQVVSPPAPPDGVCVAESPGPHAVSLLTRAEYDRTLRDLLGNDRAPATTAFPAENALTGFENDADHHRVTPLLVDLYLRTAETVAVEALASDRSRVLPCDPAVVGEQACGEMLVNTFATRAFRRELLAAERDALVGVFSSALPLWGFDKACELVLVTTLSSPGFLYRVDVQGAGAVPRGDDADVVLASSFEMASRLSYFLWGSMPDEELLAAAASGSLLDVGEVEAQARRMLDDPRAREAVGSFFRQWLGLDRIRSLTKDTAVFPEYQSAGGDALRDSWQRSLFAFVDGVIWEGSGTLEELFTSPRLDVDSGLAQLYGVPPPDDGAAMVARTAPEHTRSGLLTHPALMAMLASAVQSSPVQRGVFIREKFLCQHMQPPPPNLVITPPPANPALTTRQRFAQHTAEPACAGCHVLIDPVGFGLETYDALGRYRETENNLPVDASGELASIDEPDKEGPFSNSHELAQRLAGSKRVQGCVIDQLFRYAMGRAADEDDHCTLDRLKTRLDATPSLKELLVQVATSDAFRTTRIAVGGAP